MPVRSRFVAAAVALAALAACNRAAPTSDAALQRDLDLARGQGLELAPQGGTKLVSANELLPAGNRRRTTSTLARRATVTLATPAPQPTASHDSAVAEAPVPALPRPDAQKAVNAPPPGGYKSMGEIIRRAPFPINP